MASESVNSITLHHVLHLMESTYVIDLSSKVFSRHALSIVRELARGEEVRKATVHENRKQEGTCAQNLPRQRRERPRLAT